jgi:hypothetical protein
MSSAGYQTSEMYLRYYKPSGKTDPKALISMPICGAVAAIVLGAAYSYLTHWIPFIYIEFILTLGFGVGLGAAVGLGARVGLCRKPMLIYISAFLAGLAGVYCSWVVHMYILGSVWLFEPLELLTMIRALSDSYSISIGRASTSATTISGMGLIAVWVIEALMIIGAAVAMAALAFARVGFCERCSRWVERLSKSPIQLAPIDPARLKDVIGQRDLAALRALERAPSENDTRCTLVIEQCPRCRSMFLLTCAINTVTKDKKGNATTTTKQAFNNLIIEQDVVDVLREKQAPEPAPAA